MIKLKENGPMLVSLHDHGFPTAENALKYPAPKRAWRASSLAVFRLMGMSKVQTVKMIFIEALSGGAIGGLVGVVTGTLMIIILAGTNQSKDIHFPFGSYIVCVLAGMVLMLIASISPALKSSKLDIVSSIKLE